MAFAQTDTGRITGIVKDQTGALVTGHGDEARLHGGRVHEDRGRRGPGTVAPIRVQAAGVSESVTVTAESQVIDVSSARIGANVSEREVQGLPVNGR